MYMPSTEKVWQRIAILRWSKRTGEIDEEYTATPEIIAHRGAHAFMGARYSPPTALISR
jgi:hypothetical protein